jgi:NCAIR mutase (PurE)-related protein
MSEELDLGVAVLDTGRAHRRGIAEAVYCEGKTPDQVAAIATALADGQHKTLFTRMGPEHIAALRGRLPGAFVDETAGFAAWPAEVPPARGGRVVVACAGTSDLRVAREAQLTLEHLGRHAVLIADVGVAGLHRLLSRLDAFREARCVIVAAGMDGALPSVVAGLIEAPVIAVPTSVGYGAAFGGLAPLLTMLNSCAPGVAVVNIDNGYGAAHLAAQIVGADEPSGDPCR